MTREDLKDKLWKLRCLLDELDSNASDMTEAVGLYGKGAEVYNYLESMELNDALDAYKGLTPEQQVKFRVIVNNGETV